MLKSLRVLVLLAWVVAVIGGVTAQDSPRILRIAYTEDPELLVDYFSNTLLAQSLYRLHSQPQWGTSGTSEPIPLLVDELPSFENGGLSTNEEGNTVIQFRIADWAVWSDGTPITADDFILPVDIASDGISAILSYRVLDGTGATVEQGETEKDVIITYPFPYPDWVFSQLIPLPAHILRPEYEALLAEGRGFENSNFLRNPVVSNGPFVFAEWVTGSYIRLVRNENYWADVWFDEIQLQFFQNANVIEQLILAGEVDMTNYILPTSRSVELAEENDFLDVSLFFGSLRLELKLNLGPNGHPALKDVRVRRALAMAVDRQFMVDEIYNGATEVTNSLWGNTIWYNDEIPVYEYDPDGAIELLREAGWYDENGDGVAEAHGVEGVEDGTPLRMTASTYSSIQHYEDSLLYIQDAFSDIGVSFDITMYPVAVMHGDWNSNSPYATGIHDLYLQAWIPGLSSINIFYPYACSEIPSADNPSGWNGVHVCDERVDELWLSLATTTDDAARQAAADEIQTIIADQMLTMYLVNVMQVTLYNNRLEWESHFSSDFSPWYTVETWRFKD